MNSFKILNNLKKIKGFGDCLGLLSSRIMVISQFVKYDPLSIHGSSMACRKWEQEEACNPMTPPFTEWVRSVVHGHPIDPNNEDELDAMLLCNKPSQTATRYTKMKAYKNHFRVEDSKSNQLQTYDSGVAFVFDVPTLDAANVSMNFVGVLKDMLWANAYPCYYIQV